MKKIDRKTVKLVAQVATFFAVSATVTVLLNNYIPLDKSTKIVYRVGAALIWYATVNTSVNSVGKLLDDVFDEDTKIETL